MPATLGGLRNLLFINLSVSVTAIADTPSCFERCFFFFLELSDVVFSACFLPALAACLALDKCSYGFDPSKLWDACQYDISQLECELKASTEQNSNLVYVMAINEPTVMITILIYCRRGLRRMPSEG
jgi:hypothetical protein